MSRSDTNPGEALAYEAVVLLRRCGWCVYRHGALHQVHKPSEHHGERLLTTKQMVTLSRAERRRQRDTQSHS